jgi:hypothetical protein
MKWKLRSIIIKFRKHFLSIFGIREKNSNMGGYLTSFYDRLFNFKKEVKVLMVGLDAAGKVRGEYHIFRLNINDDFHNRLRYYTN